MELSVSNIAWDAAQDKIVYQLMREQRFSGLEIAPTRLFPHNPYDNLNGAKRWSEELKTEYGLAVSSMQSICYGRSERIFGDYGERRELLAYIKKAIGFASVIKCRNLVFGCPGNRNMPDNANIDIAVDFFRELGDYAAEMGTVIGMEANPPIYHTNFVNDTQHAIELIDKVDSLGFRLNLDLGTMIENGEQIRELNGCGQYINHVHISEPGLKTIEKREIHIELKKFLEKEGYAGYVSVEMGKVTDIAVLRDTMCYVKEILG